MAFIRLDRSFFDGKYWTSQRAFSQAEAWLDLIQSARFEAETATRILANGRRISIKRGELHASLRYLSTRWGWGVDKTRRFIENAKKDGDIEHRTEQGESIIKLCNYDYYNPMNDDSQTANQTVTKHRPNSDQTNNKKVKKDKKSNIPPLPPKGEVVKTDSLNSKARKLFECYFMETFGNDYYWAAKDAGNMSKLLDKLKYQREQKGFDCGDDGILEALEYLLKSITDGWLFENFSVPNINSKFNEILSQLKSKSNGKTKQRATVGITDEELAINVLQGIERANRKRQ
ncbi:hypothetical protein SDC9_143988 [bioreactor metagenome]|uniref:Uncharacterized protein n=1 Tax=bioreactor metagenome TaxID=1076179 RepID=A0A645E7K0_9ZZZZ